jgi:hypothetical protein
MPVDQRDRLVRHERIAQEGAQYRRVGQGPARQHEARREHRPIVAPLVDRDPEPVGVVLDVHRVATLHVEER